MFRPDQLVVDLHDRVGRESESHAGVGVRFRKNGGVDADDLSRHIHQRAAGIARIDGGVCLNK